MAVSPLKHFWGFLKNVSVLLLIIWTAIQIYGRISEGRKFDIEAAGSHMEFILPDSISIPLGFANTNSMRLAINSKFLNDPEWLRNSKLVDSVVSLTVSNFPKETSDLRNINSFWLFNISNNGEKMISDLYLETPFKGYYFIERPESVTTSIPFSKSINLGTIRPGNHLKVGCWSTSYDRQPDEVKTLLTYPEGKIRIDFGAEKSRATLDKIFIYLVGISAVTLIIYLLFVLIRHIDISLSRMRNNRN